METVELFMGLNVKWKKSHNRGIIKYAAFAQIMQKKYFKASSVKAGCTLDDFLILTDFKTMGDHRHEDSSMIFSLIILWTRTLDDSSRGSSIKSRK